MATLTHKVADGTRQVYIPADSLPTGTKKNVPRITAEVEDAVVSAGRLEEKKYLQV